MASGVYEADSGCAVAVNAAVVSQKAGVASEVYEADSRRRQGSSRRAINGSRNRRGAKNRGDSSSEVKISTRQHLKRWQQQWRRQQ